MLTLRQYYSVGALPATFQGRPHCARGGGNPVVAGSGHTCLHFSYIQTAREY